MDDEFEQPPAPPPEPAAPNPAQAPEGERYVVQLDNGVVRRLSVGEAGALVAAGLARDAVPLDLRVAGITEAGTQQEGAL